MVGLSGSNSRQRLSSSVTDAGYPTDRSTGGSRSRGSRIAFTVALPISHLEVLYCTRTFFFVGANVIFLVYFFVALFCLRTNLFKKIMYLLPLFSRRLDKKNNVRSMLENVLYIVLKGYVRGNSRKSFGHVGALQVGDNSGCPSFIMTTYGVYSRVNAEILLLYYQYVEYYNNPEVLYLQPMIPPKSFDIFSP